MAFHIVTDRCFLVCEKVTSVLIEEVERQVPVKRKRKPRKAGKKAVRKVAIETPPPPPQLFNIKIGYYPISNPRANASNYGSNNNPLEEYELNLNVEGKEKAHKLYLKIVKEVQEQHPNEGYLDKLIDELFLSEQTQAGDPNVIDR